MRNVHPGVRRNLLVRLRSPTQSSILLFAVEWRDIASRTGKQYTIACACAGFDNPTALNSPSASHSRLSLSVFWCIGVRRRFRRLQAGSCNNHAACERDRRIRSNGNIQRNGERQRHPYLPVVQERGCNYWRNFELLHHPANRRRRYWRRIYSHGLQLRRHGNKRTGNPHGSDPRSAGQESSSQRNNASLQLVRVAGSHFLGRYSHHRFDRRREFRHHRRGRKRHFVFDSAVNLAQNVHADGHGLQRQRCFHDLYSHARRRRDLADFPSEPNCRSGPDYFCSHCDWWRNQWSHLERDCGHLQRERVDFSHRCWYLHHHRNQRGRAVRFRFDYDLHQRARNHDATCERDRRIRSNCNIQRNGERQRHPYLPVVQERGCNYWRNFELLHHPSNRPERYWRRIYSHGLQLRRHRNKRTGNPHGSDPLRWPRVWFPAQQRLPTTRPCC